MSRTGPVTKNTSTVALGLAQIRVGSAASNIGSAVSVLTPDQSIGALASTKYTGEVSYWKLESGFPLLEDLTLPLRETAMLECSFKEITPKNLAIARGLDPSAGAGTLSVTGARVVSSTEADVAVVPANITIQDQAYALEGTYTVEFSTSTVYDVTHFTAGVMDDDAGVLVSTAELFSFDGANDAISMGADFVTGTITAGDIIRFEVFNVASDYSDDHAGSIGLGGIAAPAYVRMEAVYTYPNQENHMYVIFPRANAVSSTELDMQTEDAMTVPVTFEAKRADSEVVGGDVLWDSMPLGIIVFD
jgi:hypothetical protein